MENRVSIETGRYRLEGRLRIQGTAAGVVAHPHPLHGGSMTNNVVQAICDALESAGWSSLRFNFRGVGLSEGSYGDGLGEQDDVVSALSFLHNAGYSKMITIGYSFGAWVAAHAWRKTIIFEPLPPVLISPPCAFMSFESLPPQTPSSLIIVGENDTFAPVQMVQQLGLHLRQPIEPVVVGGTDHFYSGYESILAGKIKDFLVSTG